MRLIPKNWLKFQHYKDRCPPWIKLHRDILNDRVFASLPIASKALAPLLWLLASESKDGSFDAASEELAFRLHIASKDIDAGLKPLIEKGFFVDASTMLAPCLQPAIPEREGEREGEREADKKSRAAALPSDFIFNDSHATLAAKLDVPVQAEFEKFRDYHTAKGSTFKSWDAAFRTWLRNAAEFRKPSLKVVNSDLPIWER